MEREGFFSGYCRCIDGSRMVAVLAQGDTLLEVDCGFPDCPYAPACPVAQKISDFLQEGKSAR